MAAPAMVERLLGYSRNLESRAESRIEGIVIHCTELPDMDTARSYGQKIHHPESQTGNCGHLYIDRDGSIERWVALDRVAHHVRGHNANTIGIELVNLGRYPDWLDSRHQQMTEPYPAEQINALIQVLNWLCERLPSLQWVCGHEQLDTEQVPASDHPQALVQRKKDPGPMFPWSTVLASVPLDGIPDTSA